jgi:hypothetical protein
MCLKKKEEEKEEDEAKATNYYNISFFFKIILILRVFINRRTLIFYFQHYRFAVLMIYLHYQNLTGNYPLLLTYYYVLYPLQE